MENNEHHYEEYVLEENIEQDGEIIQEDIQEHTQVIYKISEFDRPQLPATTPPKNDLYLNVSFSHFQILKVFVGLYVLLHLSA